MMTISRLKTKKKLTEKKIGDECMIPTLPMTAAKLNRKNQEVEEALEEMARKGILYAVQDKEDGKKYCALFALLPGILESYHADGVDSDLRRRLDKLIDEFLARQVDDDRV